VCDCFTFCLFFLSVFLSLNICRHLASLGRALRVERVACSSVRAVLRLFMGLRQTQPDFLFAQFLASQYQRMQRPEARKRPSEGGEEPVVSALCDFVEAAAASVVDEGGPGVCGRERERDERGQPLSEVDEKVETTQSPIETLTDSSEFSAAVDMLVSFFHFASLPSLQATVDPTLLTLLVSPPSSGCEDNTWFAAMPREWALSPVSSLSQADVASGVFEKTEEGTVFSRSAFASLLIHLQPSLSELRTRITLTVARCLALDAEGGSVQALGALRDFLVSVALPTLSVGEKKKILTACMHHLLAAVSGAPAAGVFGEARGPTAGVAHAGGVEERRRRHAALVEEEKTNAEGFLRVLEGATDTREERKFACDRGGKVHLRLLAIQLQFLVIPILNELLPPVDASDTRVVDLDEGGYESSKKGERTLARAEVDALVSFMGHLAILASGFSLRNPQERLEGDTALVGARERETGSTWDDDSLFECLFPPRLDDRTSIQLLRLIALLLPYLGGSELASPAVWASPPKAALVRFCWLQQQPPQSGEGLHLVGSGTNRVPSAEEESSLCAFARVSSVSSVGLQHVALYVLARFGCMYAPTPRLHLHLFSSLLHACPSPVPDMVADALSRLLPLLPASSAADVSLVHAPASAALEHLPFSLSGTASLTKERPEQRGTGAVGALPVAPPWIRVFLRTLQEMRVMPFLMHPFQCLYSSETLFFPYRQALVPLLLSTNQHLLRYQAPVGVQAPAAGAADQRAHVLNVISVILGWELRSALFSVVLQRSSAGEPSETAREASENGKEDEELEAARKKPRVDQESESRRAAPSARGGKEEHDRQQATATDEVPRDEEEAFLQMQDERRVARIRSVFAVAHTSLRRNDWFTRCCEQLISHACTIKARVRQDILSHGADNSPSRAAAAAPSVLTQAVDAALFRRLSASEVNQISLQLIRCLTFLPSSPSSPAYPIQAAPRALKCLALLLQLRPSASVPLVLVERLCCQAAQTSGVSSWLTDSVAGGDRAVGQEKERDKERSSSDKPASGAQSPGGAVAFTRLLLLVLGLCHVLVQQRGAVCPCEACSAGVCKERRSQKRRQEVDEGSPAETESAKDGELRAHAAGHPASPSTPREGQEMPTEGRQGAGMGEEEKDSEQRGEKTDTESFKYEEKKDDNLRECACRESLPQIVEIILLAAAGSSDSRVLLSVQALVAKLVLLHPPSEHLVKAVRSGPTAFASWASSRSFTSPFPSTQAATSPLAPWWTLPVTLPLSMKSARTTQVSSPVDYFYYRLLSAIFAGFHSCATSSFPSYPFFYLLTADRRADAQSARSLGVWAEPRRLAISFPVSVHLAVALYSLASLDVAAGLSFLYFLLPSSLHALLSVVYGLREFALLGSRGTPGTSSGPWARTQAPGASGRTAPGPAGRLRDGEVQAGGRETQFFFGSPFAISEENLSDLQQSFGLLLGLVTASPALLRLTPVATEMLAELFKAVGGGGRPLGRREGDKKELADRSREETTPASLLVLPALLALSRVMVHPTVGLEDIVTGGDASSLSRDLRCQQKAKRAVAEVEETPCCACRKAEVAGREESGMETDRKVEDDEEGCCCRSSLIAREAVQRLTPGSAVRCRGRYVIRWCGRGGRREKERGIEIENEVADEHRRLPTDLESPKSGCDEVSPVSAGAPLASSAASPEAEMLRAMRVASSSHAESNGEHEEEWSLWGVLAAAAVPQEALLGGHTGRSGFSSRLHRISHLPSLPEIVRRFAASSRPVRWAEEEESERALKHENAKEKCGESPVSPSGDMAKSEVNGESREAEQASAASPANIETKKKAARSPERLATRTKRCCGVCASTRARKCGPFTIAELQSLLLALAPAGDGHAMVEAHLLVHSLVFRLACFDVPLARDYHAIHRRVALLLAATEEAEAPGEPAGGAAIGGGVATNGVGVEVEARRRRSTVCFSCLNGLLAEHMEDLFLSQPLLRCLLLAAQSALPAIRHTALEFLHARLPPFATLNDARGVAQGRAPGDCPLCAMKRDEADGRNGRAREGEAKRWSRDEAEALEASAERLVCLLEIGDAWEIVGGRPGVLHTILTLVFMASGDLQHRELLGDSDGARLPPLLPALPCLSAPSPSWLDATAEWNSYSVFSLDRAALALAARGRQLSPYIRAATQIYASMCSPEFPPPALPFVLPSAEKSAGTRQDSREKQEAEADERRVENAEGAESPVGTRATAATGEACVSNTGTGFEQVTRERREKRPFEASSLVLDLSSQTSSFAEWKANFDAALRLHTRFLAASSTVLLFPSSSKCASHFPSSSTSPFFLPSVSSSSSSCLLDLAFLAPRICASVWASLFQVLWRAVGPTTRRLITRAFTVFLANPSHLRVPFLSSLPPSHQRQQHHLLLSSASSALPNSSACAGAATIHPLLSAFLRCSPIPVFPSDLLFYLAKTFACYHEVLPLLQNTFLCAFSERVFPRPEKVELTDLSPTSANGDSAGASSLEDSRGHTKDQEGSKTTPETDVDMDGGDSANRPADAVKREPQEEARSRHSEASAGTALDSVKEDMDDEETDDDSLWQLQSGAVARQAAVYLHELYGQLEEPDYEAGVVASRLTTAEGSAALAFLQHGFYNQAKNRIVEAMKTVASPRADVEDEEQKEEVFWWNVCWLATTKHLNQWNSLNEYASSLGSESQLGLDCASKLQNWDLLEHMVDAYGVHTPYTKLCQAYQALHEVVYPRGRQDGEVAPWMQTQKLREMDLRCCEGQRLLLSSWRRLPAVITDAHIALLVQFQLYVELLEGYHLVVHLSRRLQKGGEFPAARTTLNTWRERLPNTWDSIDSWNDLFVWRNFIFSIIQSTVTSSPVLTPSQKTSWPAYVQDMPWTMLKFVSIARSPNRLREVSLALLMKMDNLPAMKNPAYATEAFIAMTEKAKLCLGDPAQYATGLQLLNAFDFDFPGPSSVSSAAASPVALCADPHVQQQLDAQRLQLLRLKAILMFRLYTLDRPNAFQGVSREELLSGADSLLRSTLAVQPLCGAAWLTWAKMNESLFFLHNGPATLSALSASAEAAEGESSDACETHKKEEEETLVRYLLSAMVGFLMNLQLRPAKGRLYLSRILWLLSYDVGPRRPLAKAFRQLAPYCPIRCFLPWLPQLLSGLDRPEAPEMDAILYHLMLQLPQAVYFDVRTAYMERREYHAQQSSAGSSALTTPLFYLSRLMSLFRTTFTPQCVALEHLAEEFVTQAKPSSVDEILCAVRTLFQQCLEISHSHTKLPPVAAHFLKVNILSRYRARYGQGASRAPAPDTRSSGSSRSSRSAPGNSGNDEAARRVMEALWPHFEKDFTFESSSIDLSDVIVKLKKWKDLLGRRTQLLQRGSSLPLEDISYSLCDLFLRVNVRLEVPGQLWKSISDPASADFDVGVHGSIGGLLPPTHSHAKPAPSSVSSSWRGSSAAEKRDADDSARGGRSGAGGAAAALMQGDEEGSRKAETQKEGSQSLVPHAFAAAGAASPQTVYIEGFASEASTSTRSHYTLKRLGFIGSNGNTYYFVVQPYSTQHQRTEQRLLQLLSLINQLLFKFKDTRGRGLSFTLHAQIPVHPRCRLMEDPPSLLTLQEILQEVSASGSETCLVDPDLPVLLHRQLIRLHLHRLLFEKAQELKRRGVASIPKGLQQYIEASEEEGARGKSERAEDDEEAAATEGESDVRGDREGRDEASGERVVPEEKGKEATEETSAEASACAAAAAATTEAGEVKINGSEEKLDETHVKAEKKDEDQEDERVTAWYNDVYRACQIQAAQETFDDLCELVSSDVLRLFVANLLPNNDELFVFRKRFTQSVGLFGLLNYILSMADINPSKIRLSLETGVVSQLELKPCYNGSTLSLDFVERVPFRLTRNIESLIGPFGRLGVLPSVIFSFVRCLRRYKDHLSSALCLFVRDDITAFHIQRKLQHSAPSGKGRNSPIHQILPTRSLKEMSEANAKKILEAIERIESAPAAAAEKATGALAPGEAGDREDPPVNHHVMILLSIATKKEFLAMMKPTWQAWF
ncbi:non-specific serine/threonine protein kinase, partial [Toxoplasma gondii ARI]